MRRENLGDVIIPLSYLAQAYVYGRAALYGEHLQKLAYEGQRDYDLLQGHLSDAAGASLLSVLGYALTYQHQKFRKYVPLAVYALMALNEIKDHRAVDTITQKPFITDWRDLIAIGVGVGLAYVVTAGIDRYVHKHF